MFPNVAIHFTLQTAAKALLQLWQYYLFVNTKFMPIGCVSFIWKLTGVMPDAMPGNARIPTVM
jgi:hypothetical protein